jgi:hypothetical protein
LAPLGNWHKLCYYPKQILITNPNEKGVIKGYKRRRGFSEVSEKEQVSFPEQKTNNPTSQEKKGGFNHVKAKRFHID